MSDLKTDAHETIGILDDAQFDRHQPPPGHPERPERLLAARSAVASIQSSTRALIARDGTPQELGRVHTSDHLERLLRLDGADEQLDEDTYTSPGSVAAAVRAAGGACVLVEALLRGDVRRGAALLRPPGHHARPDRAMGFCLLNNVAIAAAHARALGVERILIVDWDVHHGNGTQEIFFEDPHVLYASLHQWPFYPGTGSVDEIGEGEGRGYTVNVPLSEGAREAEYLCAFERVLLPAADDYAPELVLVSAGFDAHAADPLANMGLRAASFARMTAMLAELADKHASGRIALVLEGGYELRALEQSLASCLRVLARSAPEGAPAAASPSSVHPRFEEQIERARRKAALTWTSCR